MEHLKKTASFIFHLAVRCCDHFLMNWMICDTSKTAYTFTTLECLQQPSQMSAIDWLVVRLLQLTGTQLPCQVRECRKEGKYNANVGEFYVLSRSAQRKPRRLCLLAQNKMMWRHLRNVRD